VVAREHGNVHRSGEFGAAAMCACSSAATRCAGRSASPSCCLPANAMRAAGGGLEDAYPQRPRLLDALRSWPTRRHRPRGRGMRGPDIGRGDPRRRVDAAPRPGAR
jgi:tRNA nucleotidyltransferase (CCA-adding enzyme)